MRKIMKSALIAIIATTLVTACDSQGDLSAQDAVATTEVEVFDNRFEPAVISIEPGDTVTWTWQGQAPHDVVGDGFESDVQTTGTFTHTFDEGGEYDYVCRIHPGMEGLVVVEEG
jgi:plastocyanin